MANQLYIRQLHTLPTMVWQILDETGCPVNLTDTVLGEAQKVTFTLVKADRALTPVIIEAPATFLDKTKGLLEYKWTKYDTMYFGFYHAMFTVYYASVTSSGSKSSVSYDGIVYEALDLGESLNNRAIIFDGIQSADAIVSAWNTNNPESHIGHNSVDGTVVPIAGQGVFSGGSDTIVLEKKIGYPPQREDLELSVEKVYGNGDMSAPPVTPPDEIEEWLADRLRVDFVPPEQLNGTNKVFSTTPYFFTVNVSFTIKVKFNGQTLVRGVDYYVASTNPNKQGYNQIVLDSDFDAPNSAEGDNILFDFYISDRN